MNYLDQILYSEKRAFEQWNSTPDWARAEKAEMSRPLKEIIRRTIKKEH